MDHPPKILKRRDRAKLNTLIDKRCKERITEMARLNCTSITKQLESMINGFWEHNAKEWDDLRKQRVLEESERAANNP